MKDKKKVWLIILSVINILLSFCSLFSFNSSKEEALKLVSSFPESLQDRMMTVYSNDIIYILPSLICIIFGLLILYFCSKDQVSKRRNLILGLFIASLLFSSDGVVSLISIIGIVICATIKPLSTRNTKKNIPNIEVEKLTKKSVLGSILCLLVYFSHMFLPIHYSIIFVILFYFLIFFLCLFIFRDEIFSGFKLLKENFGTYISYIFPKLGIIYIIYVISTLLVVYVFNQGVSANQQSVEELPLFVSLPLAVIWAPIVEETLFRGCIRKLIKSDFLFIVLSGFIFGLLHTMGEESLLSAFTLMIPYGVLGGGFAYIYTKTNNIATNMMCHSMHNFVVMLLQIILFHI